MLKAENYGMNKRFQKFVLAVADPGISKRGGGAVPARFLGLGFVLMPLHTYHVFVARVMNKIHNVNIVY